LALLFFGRARADSKTIPANFAASFVRSVDDFLPTGMATHSISRASKVIYGHKKTTPDEVVST
jgi:hypothetical protein